MTDVGHLFYSAQDYDTAKLLKEAETQLKSLGQQLAQLEVAKRQAVEDEDYDRAKMLKVRLDSAHLHTQRAKRKHCRRGVCHACIPAASTSCYQALAMYMHVFTISPCRWRRILCGYRSPLTPIPSSARSWKKQACRYSHNGV